ncbi:MAG TPA: hypothetical protein VKB45_02735, partial [Gemmatimonadales bacterium]|nr:hypothetical protein [Gemmatimonadales bacterium]
MRTPPQTPVSLRSVLTAAVRHRGVQAAVALWVVAHLVVLWLAHGSLPFDRPAVAHLPFASQIAAPTIGMIEILALMVVTFLLTRRRVIPDIAARAPEHRVALRETLLVLAYAVIGQVGGWIVGPLLGYRPFSFHLAGTLYGSTLAQTPADVWIWASYNFLVFAVVPYLYFRRRYSTTELNLRSVDRPNDARLILVILVLESLFEVSAFSGILHLSPRQLLLGAPLSFAVFFIGTVLPTMVLIYAILLPRYFKLTGSAISTVLLGGLTYAAMHLVEGWSAFGSPRDAALSLLFVLLSYVGPGMIKSVLTLRSGNAWVHALGYHAVAPHVVVDAPLVVKIF